MAKRNGATRTMVMKEIVLGRAHTCPQCGHEMKSGDMALSWFNTRFKKNSAIYCGRECFDDAQLKRHGFQSRIPNPRDLETLAPYREAHVI